jgi:hypothetical protein
MSDNVTQFPQRAADPNIHREIADNAVMGEPINLAGGDTIEVTAEGLGFTDLEAALNMRGWLERACGAAGAKCVGAGIGFGQADIDIELEGCRFNISIRPQS